MGRHSCGLKQKLRKGLWSPEEDEKLFNYITRYGVGCWSSVPKLAGLQRCGKSCRLRWMNYLRPDLKRGMFSQQEEDLIISLHQALGNRWAQIAAQLPGRTDNEIKNYWNSYLKKKLMKQGIDPCTHKPITHTLVAAPQTFTSGANEPTFIDSNFSTSYYPEKKQLYDIPDMSYVDSRVQQYNFETAAANNSFSFGGNMSGNGTELSDNISGNSTVMNSLFMSESSSNSSSSTFTGGFQSQMLENAAWNSIYQFQTLKTDEGTEHHHHFINNVNYHHQLQSQNSVEFSSFPLTSLSSEDLTGASFDVFHSTRYD